MSSIYTMSSVEAAMHVDAERIKEKVDEKIEEVYLRYILHRGEFRHTELCLKSHIPFSYLWRARFYIDFEKLSPDECRVILEIIKYLPPKEVEGVAGFIGKDPPAFVRTISKIALHERIPITRLCAPVLRRISKNVSLEDHCNQYTFFAYVASIPLKDRKRIVQLVDQVVENSAVLCARILRIDPKMVERVLEYGLRIKNEIYPRPWGFFPILSKLTPEELPLHFNSLKRLFEQTEAEGDKDNLYHRLVNYEFNYGLWEYYQVLNLAASYVKPGISPMHILDDIIFLAHHKRSRVLQLAEQVAEIIDEDKLRCDILSFCSLIPQQDIEPILNALPQVFEGVHHSKEKKALFDALFPAYWCRKVLQIGVRFIKGVCPPFRAEILEAIYTKGDDRSEFYAGLEKELQQVSDPNQRGCILVLASKYGAIHVPLLRSLLQGVTKEADLHHFIDGDYDIIVMESLFRSIDDPHLKAALFSIVKRFQGHEGEAFQFLLPMFQGASAVEIAQATPLLRESDGAMIAQVEGTFPGMKLEHKTLIYKALVGLDQADCFQILTRNSHKFFDKTDQEKALLFTQYAALYRIFKEHNLDDISKYYIEGMVLSTRNQISAIVDAVQRMLRFYDHKNRSVPIHVYINVRNRMSGSVELSGEQKGAILDQETIMHFLGKCVELFQPVVLQCTKNTEHLYNCEMIWLTIPSPNREICAPFLLGLSDGIQLLKVSQKLRKILSLSSEYAQYLKDLLPKLPTQKGDRATWIEQQIYLLHLHKEFPECSSSRLEELTRLPIKMDAIEKRIRKCAPPLRPYFLDVLLAEHLLQELYMESSTLKGLISTFLTNIQMYLLFILKEHNLCHYLIRYHQASLHKAIAGKTFPAEVQSNLIPFLTPSEIIHCINGLEGNDFLEKPVFFGTEVWKNPVEPFRQLQGSNPNLILKELGEGGMIHAIPFAALSFIAKRYPKLLLPHLLLFDDLQLAAILPFLRDEEVLNLLKNVPIEKLTRLAKRATVSLKVKLLELATTAVVQQYELQIDHPLPYRDLQNLSSGLTFKEGRLVELENACKKADWGDDTPITKSRAERMALRSALDKAIKNHPNKPPQIDIEVNIPEKYECIVSKAVLAHPISLPCGRHVDFDSLHSLEDHGQYRDPLNNKPFIPVEDRSLLLELASIDKYTGLKMTEPVLVVPSGRHIDKLTYLKCPVDDRGYIYNLFDDQYYPPEAYRLEVGAP